MQPVRQLLGATSTVLVSPDSVLHLVPFAALVDEQERYLVEQYQFIYLTTGRDLLRLQVQPPPAQGTVVIAHPDFGTTSVAEATQGVASQQGTTTRVAAARVAVDVSQLSFSPLPGTADEAQVL
jgi:CHAT domain-containing protein